MLKENSQGKYEFGCVMLLLSKNLLKLTKYIDKKDLYIDPNDPSYGLEDQPHVTIIYGLDKDYNNDEILKFLVTPSPLILENISLFENEKYDVLKWDVSNCGFLYKENKLINKYLSHNESKFEYHPHCTIGYFQKGLGQKYVDKFKDLVVNQNPSSYLYSKMDGSKNVIKK